MDYNSVRILKDLFKSGSNIIFTDAALSGDVLYFESNYCWIHGDETNEAVEINLDFYDMSQFKVEMEKTDER